MKKEIASGMIATISTKTGDQSQLPPTKSLLSILLEEQKRNVGVSQEVQLSAVDSDKTFSCSQPWEEMQDPRVWMLMESSIGDNTKDSLPPFVVGSYREPQETFTLKFASNKSKSTAVKR